jgi:hypothetical protein
VSSGVLVLGDAVVGGFGNTGKYLEQGSLPCAIVPDDAEYYALLHFEVNILQGPEHAFVIVDEAEEGVELPEVLDWRSKHRAFCATSVSFRFSFNPMW